MGGEPGCQGRLMLPPACPQGVAVVGELGLEGKLFAWVAAGVVYPLAPDGERAEGLQLGMVAQPVLLQRGQRLGVAGVQSDDLQPT